MNCKGTFLVVACFAFCASAARAQVLERDSVDSAGAQAFGNSFRPAVSSDGRFVAFDSFEIYVHDRTTGATTCASVDSTGVQANSWCSSPALSSDGRFVAFESWANNLVAGDTNGGYDIFVHDRNTGATTRVSVDSAGAQANGNSWLPDVSADGRFVAFHSDASNLVAGDANGTFDVFVHDRATGATTLVSVDSTGAQANNWSTQAVLSSDGRFVAFTSAATNLVAGDTNGFVDIFVHDRTTGATTRSSVDTTGAQANGSSFLAAVSSDGRFVAFESDAANLVAGDTNGATDVFVHDRTTGATTRVNVDSTGAQAVGNASSGAAVTSDGRFVAFQSDATNLVAGDTNGTTDVFVHDRTTGATRRVSVDSTGAQAVGGASSRSAVSSNGRFVAFDSFATNLVAGDTNGLFDVFTAGNPLFPPTAGTVNDGTGADVDTQVAGTAVSANWTGFTPASTAVVNYEWAVGTTAGGTDLQPFTSVGAATSATNAGLIPATGSTVYASVRATDANGNVSAAATSDGVQVVASPGTGGGGNSGPCNMSTVAHGGSGALALAAALTLLALAARR